MATPTHGHFHAPTRIHVGLRNKIKEMCLYSFYFLEWSPIDLKVWFDLEIMLKCKF